MNILIICIVIVAVYYFYKRRKNKKSEGGYVAANASLGQIIPFSDQQLQETSNKNPEVKAFEKIKELEKQYGDSLREGLNALFSNLLLKGNRTLSGKTSQVGRQVAETVATIDNRYIISIFRGNPDAYQEWWLNALVILNGIIIDNQQSPKQTALWMDMTKDFNDVNSILERNDILKKMSEGEIDELESFIDDPIKNIHRNIKIKYRTSSVGLWYYEMQGGYKYFRTDLSPDFLTRLVELFIASVAVLQHPNVALWRCDLEKYGLPGVEKMERML